MAGDNYRYELHRGEELLATGRFSRDRPLEIGERVVIAGKPGIVRSVEPVLAGLEQRLVVQLLPDRL